MTLPRIFLVITFLALQATAMAGVFNDTTLNFNKRFSESERKWVAFPKKEGSNDHAFGIIYIDHQAGFTFDIKGFFKIEGNKFIPDTSLTQNNSVKYRLQPNTSDVAWIPDSKIREMGFPLQPKWLDTYYEYTDTMAHDLRWAWHYNHIGESEIALKYLLPLYKKEPHYKGLAFELSFAHNVLKEFDKAIEVLVIAIKEDPNECLLYKELSYAEVSLGKLEQAEATCKKGIEYCEEKEMKAEMAYNLAYQYYKKKENDKFRVWADETKKWGDPKGQIIKNISIMEKQIGQ